MPETKTVTVFEFDELDQQAKEFVRTYLDDEDAGDHLFYASGELFDH